MLAQQPPLHMRSCSTRPSVKGGRTSHADTQTQVWYTSHFSAAPLSLHPAVTIHDSDVRRCQPPYYVMMSGVPSIPKESEGRSWVWGVTLLDPIVLRDVMNMRCEFRQGLSIMNARRMSNSSACSDFSDGPKESAKPVLWNLIAASNLMAEKNSQMSGSRELQLLSGPV